MYPLVRLVEEEPTMILALTHAKAVPEYAIPAMVQQPASAIDHNILELMMDRLLLLSLTLQIAGLQEIRAHQRAFYAIQVIHFNLITPVQPHVHLATQSAVTMSLLDAFPLVLPLNSYLGWARASTIAMLL